MRIARYLRDRGVLQVVAPLPTRAGTLWVEVAGFTVTLSPFIEGTTGAEHGLTVQHWVTYGATLRALHSITLPPDLARLLRRETFTSVCSEIVQRLEAHITTRTFADSAAREVAAFWQARRKEIRTLVERAEILGQRLRASRKPLVPCHADIHTWNLLIDTADRLWIVDWDEVLLAPKECDLMFVLGGLERGLVEPREEAWFLTGYGETTVDALALAYYRYARAVADIAAYGERVFLLPALGSITKRDARQGLRRLFAPGNTVALAQEAYSRAP